MTFPREGTAATPPHPASSFAFKDYMPQTFRKLREIFAIDAADYMLSICGGSPARCTQAQPAYQLLSLDTPAVALPVAAVPCLCHSVLRAVLCRR